MHYSLYFASTILQHTVLSPLNNKTSEHNYIEKLKKIYNIVLINREILKSK